MSLLLSVVIFFAHLPAVLAAAGIQSFSGIAACQSACNSNCIDADGAGTSGFTCTDLKSNTPTATPTPSPSPSASVDPTEQQRQAALQCIANQASAVSSCSSAKSQVETSCDGNGTGNQTLDSVSNQTTTTSSDGVNDSCSNSKTISDSAYSAVQSFCSTCTEATNSCNSSCQTAENALNNCASANSVAASVVKNSSAYSTVQSNISSCSSVASLYKDKCQEATNVYTKSSTAAASCKKSTDDSGTGGTGSTDTSSQKVTTTTTKVNADGTTTTTTSTTQKAATAATATDPTTAAINSLVSSVTSALTSSAATTTTDASDIPSSDPNSAYCLKNPTVSTCVANCYRTDLTEISESTTCICFRNPNDAKCLAAATSTTTESLGAGGGVESTTTTTSTSALDLSDNSAAALAASMNSAHGNRSSGMSETPGGKQGNGAQISYGGGAAPAAAKSAQSQGAGTDLKAKAITAGFYGAAGGVGGSTNTASNDGRLSATGSAYDANGNLVISKQKNIDLRQFLPGGKMDPQVHRGIAGSASSELGEGIDGITGAQTVNWNKMSNRFKSLDSTFLP